MSRATMVSDGSYYGKKHASTGGTFQVSCPEKHEFEGSPAAAWGSLESTNKSGKSVSVVLKRRRAPLWRRLWLINVWCFATNTSCDRLSSSIGTHIIVSDFGVLGRAVVQLVFGIYKSNCVIPIMHATSLCNVITRPPQHSRVKHTSWRERNGGVVAKLNSVAFSPSHFCRLCPLLARSSRRQGKPLMEARGVSKPFALFPWHPNN